MYANIKRNTCKHPGCKLPVFAQGLCKPHQRYREQPTSKNIDAGNGDKKVEKPHKKIARESKNRAVINRLYAERSKNFRAANPACKIQSPICTGRTQGVHHVKGKATTELLLDEIFWLPSCNACNSIWIEEHPEWAKERGFKILDGSSKLSKFKK